VQVERQQNLPYPKAVVVDLQSLDPETQGEEKEEEEHSLS